MIINYPPHGAARTRYNWFCGVCRLACSTATMQAPDCVCGADPEFMAFSHATLAGALGPSPDVITAAGDTLMDTQTSHDRTDWAEHPDLETRRRTLAATDSYDTIRRLFPYSLRLLKNDGITKLPAEAVLVYARTRRYPALYPIEACIIKQGDTRPHIISYNSQEAQLMPPVKPATAASVIITPRA